MCDTAMSHRVLALVPKEIIAQAQVVVDANKQALSDAAGAAGPSDEVQRLEKLLK